MSEQLKIERTLSCEWWILRAAFLTLAPFFKPEAMRIGDYFIADGCEFLGMVSVKDADGSQSVGIGTMILTAAKNRSKTRLVVEAPGSPYVDFWRDSVQRLENFTLTLHDGRANITSEPRTPDEAIEYYYRSRAAGSKITLREVASRINMSEKRLRNLKVEYDREGKWGSKKKPK